MVSGDVHDAGSAACPLEQCAKHLLVRLRPVHAALQAPEVDDVTDEVQGVALDLTQEIEEVLRAAASEGIPIMTQELNKPLYEKWFTNTRTLLMPDKLSLSEKKAKFGSAPYLAE